eukprot:9470673-Pyramimonas_sp.AAC.1
MAEAVTAARRIHARGVRRKPFVDAPTVALCHEAGRHSAGLENCCALNETTPSHLDEKPQYK